jgi:hypothetical protein
LPWSGAGVPLWAEAPPRPTITTREETAKVAANCRRTAFRNSNTRRRMNSPISQPSARAEDLADADVMASKWVSNAAEKSRKIQ